MGDSPWLRRAHKARSLRERMGESPDTSISDDFTAHSLDASTPAPARRITRLDEIRERERTYSNSPQRAIDRLDMIKARTLRQQQDAEAANLHTTARPDSDLHRSPSLPLSASRKSNIPITEVARRSELDLHRRPSLPLSGTRKSDSPVARVSPKVDLSLRRGPSLPLSTTRKMLSPVTDIEPQPDLILRQGSSPSPSLPLPATRKSTSSVGEFGLQSDNIRRRPSPSLPLPSTRKSTSSVTEIGLQSDINIRHRLSSSLPLPITKRPASPVADVQENFQHEIRELYMELDRVSQSPPTTPAEDGRTTEDFYRHVQDFRARLDRLTGSRVSPPLVPQVSTAKEDVQRIKAEAGAEDSTLDMTFVKPESDVSNEALSKKERAHRLEMLSYDRMNKHLKTARLGIQDTKRGIDRLDKQVATLSDEHTLPAVGCNKCTCQNCHKSKDESKFEFTIRIPKLYTWRRQRPALTWLGVIVFSFLVWFVAESLMCHQFCHPKYASGRVNWSPSDPFFPYALPTKIWQWLCILFPNRYAGGRLSRASSRLRPTPSSSRPTSTLAAWGFAMDEIVL